MFPLIETGPHKTDPDSVSFVTQEDVQFSIWVSFFEIYNELIYDLLETPPSAPNRKRPTLRLCEDHTGNTYVKGTAKPSHPEYTLDYICRIINPVDQASNKPYSEWLEPVIADTFPLLKCDVFPDNS